MAPPAGDRRDRELRGVGVDPDADPALVQRDVIYAVGVDLAELLVLEVVHAHLDRVALGAPLTPTVAKVADEFLLLVSTLIACWPASNAALTVALMWPNCASRSG
jgi:hypothetical protein